MESEIEAEERRGQVRRRSRRRRPLLSAAIALGLLGLVAIEADRWWSDPAVVSPVAYEAGSLVATGRLENALYNPSTAQRQGEPLAGPSFRNNQGETCRRFADGLVRGTACQREGDWRLVEMRQEDPNLEVVQPGATSK